MTEKEYQARLERIATAVLVTVVDMADFVEPVDTSDAAFEARIASLKAQAFWAVTLAEELVIHVSLLSPEDTGVDMVGEE